MNYQNQHILIEGIKRGDEPAFAYIINAYSKPLFAYARSLTNDTAMAQDILQNVFLKTWEKRAKINISISLLNYLYRATYNEFINQYKKNKATLFLEQKYYEALDKIINKEDELSTKKNIEQVALEIEKLPSKCREVFLLSRKEGLTNIEIANYLNISVKSVEAHITKAFFTLKKNIGRK